MAADRVVVTLPVDKAGLVENGATSGRMIVFLKSERSPERGDPADGPFFRDPQPIMSVAVTGLQPGVAVSFDQSTVAWPSGIDALQGGFVAQAVFKRSRDEGAIHAAGNLISKPIEITLSADRDDVVEIELQKAIEPLNLPKSKTVVEIDEPSPLLTRAIGRVVRHRAAVVLPHGYHDPDFPRRMWPTIYIIPGFGGRMTIAADTERLLAMPHSETTVPQGVYVVLDPEGPFGHHGFADSVVNGPRGAALVQELIPLIEDRFRVIRQSEARLLTGHSSGGWSSLWLQLTNPDVFGGCWSSAPDPVDFSAFGQCNLYRDDNLFVDPEGAERSSYRRPVGPMERVLMTVGEEIGMEHAIDPNGGSGQQWDAWNAMFSMPNSATGMPKRLADPESGVINHRVVNETWSAYDISRLIESRWKTLSPVLANKVHVLVGDRDNFYLERAVKKFKDKIDLLRSALAGEAQPHVGTGFIEIIPDATHDTIAVIARGRFALGMREHLKRHGFCD